MTLSNQITESFDNGTGALTGKYTQTNNTTFSGSYQTHYDLRTFDANTNIYRQTVADLSLYNVGYLGGSGTAHNFTVGQLQNKYLSGVPYQSIENWVMVTSGSGGSITLNTSVQSINDGANVISARIGPSPSHTYTPALKATFSGTNAKIKFISSSGVDDILTNFNNPNQEYDITFTIRNVPPQTAALTFDLNQSYLSFNNGADRILFNRFGELSPTSTTDATIRFNRNLIGSTLQQMANVHLNIVTKGAGVFTSYFQDLRVVPSGVFNNPYALVNTRTNRYTRNIESSASAPGLLSFTTAKPKNVIHNVKFNTGTIPPVVSGTNTFVLYYRQYPDYQTNNVAVRFTASGTNSKFSVYQTVSGSASLVGSFTSTTLSGSTDYIYRTVLSDDRIVATLYRTDGTFLGPTVATTGNLNLPVSLAYKRGFVGFDFVPCNYDFQLVEMSMQRAEFGSAKTAPQLSFKPVKATQLYTNTSGPVTLIDQTNLTQYGDGILTLNQTSGDPAPDYILTRSGTMNTLVVTPTSNWSGGVISSGTFNIYDPNELYVAGSIFPYVTGSQFSTTYSGTFQIGLINKDNLVGFVQTIPNIVGGQWNDFVIPLNRAVVSGKYRLFIRNIGYYAERFEIDNFSVYHNTISWSAANDGTNFLPFYDNINNQYAMLSFPGQHPQIQLNATALSDTNAWVESWVNKPIYQD